MKIGSIQSTYGGVHNINSIPRVDEKQLMEEQKAQTLKEDAMPLASQNSHKTPVQPVQLQDISLIFNKGETYDYIGKDSDLDNLDVKKAVSDMKKDQLLEQYQFFVGTQPVQDVMLDNADGMVIRK